MPKVVAPDLPPKPTDFARTRVDEDAVAEIARESAGNAAMMYGYICGPDEIAENTPNPCPPAPGHGLQCHDHSGGRWGRPFLKSVFQLHTSKGDFHAGASNVTTNLRGGDWFLSGLTDGAKKSSTLESLMFQPNLVAVPGCDPVYGAYAFLGLQASCACLANNTLVTGDVLKLVVINLTTGHRVEFQLDETSSAEQIFESAAANDPTELLAMQPGAINLVQALFTVELEGSGSARAVDVELLELEGGVYAT